MIRELLGWPPRPGGAGDGRSPEPTSDEAVLAEVFPASHEWVTFTCRFESRIYSYDFRLSNVSQAEQVTAALHGNVGKSITQLGELPVS